MRHIEIFGDDRAGSASEASLVGYHIRQAHATVKGEHQLAEYVATLGLGQCARILATSPVGLPSFAAQSPQCRVEEDEGRGFEEVIRAWTLHVLSRAEGTR